ncbi:hypothetical protein J4E08_17555 [Sagittula sp. NFXS13]
MPSQSTFEVSLPDRIESATPCITLLRTSPHLLYVRPPVSLSRDVLLPLLKQICATSDYPANVATLWDLRGCDFAQCTSDMVRTLAFDLQKLPDRRGARRGILVDSDAGFGTGRMFQQTVDGYRIEDQNNFIVSYSAEELIEALSKTT